MLDSRSVPQNKKKLVVNKQIVSPRKEASQKIANKNKIKKLHLLWAVTNLLISSVILIGVTPVLQKWFSGISTAKANQSSRQSPRSTTALSSLLPVETMVLEKQKAYQVGRSYTGKIESYRSSELGFERSGQVMRVEVKEGDRVSKGTPLASLDTRNLVAQEQEILAQRAQAVAKLREKQAGPRRQTIAAAQASVRNLKSQLVLAENKHKRRESLYKQGAISREQFEEVLFEEQRIQALLDEAQSKVEELREGTRPERIEAQQAQIKQLDASLKSIRINKEKSILKAPFSGTISVRYVDEGTAVSNRDTIVRLVEDGKIEAKIGIPVNADNKIEEGSRQKLKIGDKEYEATVSSILPELDSRNRTLTVVLTLDESARGEVWAGQVAKLNIQNDISSSGYWLPTTALVRGGRGLWSVYVLGKPAEVSSGDSSTQKAFHIEKRFVEILHMESNRVFVRGTLQDRDRVVINGTHRLVPNQIVISSL
ncbi:MAG: efflux RND transporter periplasmic adaptor subunit [Prochloraceae cyanobacterium]|nr:efflux RND transporter periplasmic adaptor subunit [Prochloraceae cyanobacterium]